MELVEVKQNLECHCCISNEGVSVCELDNCEYPLCSTCKDKALKLEHKCPGCRRNVIVDINELELEPDIEYMMVQRKCNENCYEKIFMCLYSFIMGIATILASTCIFFMICVIGRLITQMFEIGPYDFWCYSTGEYHFGFFIGWGLLGFIIGFFIACCSWGALYTCCCSDDNGYDC